MSDKVDEKLLKDAQSVCRTVCEYFDDMKWHYKKTEGDDEDLIIETSTLTDDLDINTKIIIEPKQELITFMSTLPYSLSTKEYGRMAVLINQVNDRFVWGNFDYLEERGRIYFEITQSYTSSLIGKPLIEKMTRYIFSIVDDYNEKFFLFDRGMISAEKVLDIEE
jgi:hypothetical protein